MHEQATGKVVDGSVEGMSHMVFAPCHTFGILRRGRWVNAPDRRLC